MSLATPIERMDDRMDAIAQSLSGALSTRIIKRSLLPYTDHSAQEIAAGVVTVISAGEGNYNKGLGLVARDGHQSVLLIGHLKLAEGEPGQAIEAAELDLIEEIKAWVRAPGIEGLSLRLDHVQHSRQLDNPFGWIVAALEAGPPRSTVR